MSYTLYYLSDPTDTDFFFKHSICTFKSHLRDEEMKARNTSAFDMKQAGRGPLAMNFKIS